MKSDPTPLPLHGSIEEVAELIQAVCSDIGWPTKWVQMASDGEDESHIMFGPNEDVAIMVRVSAYEPDFARIIGREPPPTWGYSVALFCVDVISEHFTRNYHNAARIALKFVMERLIDESLDMITLVMDERKGDLLMEAQDMAADERRERGCDD